MANFNEELYQRLQPYERTLRTAYYANYVMSVPNGTGKELTAIYNEIYSTDRQWSNCPKCLLELAKRIGEHYFAHQTALGMHPEEVDRVVKVFNKSKPAEKQEVEEPEVTEVNEEMTEVNEPKPQPKKNKKPNKKSNGKKG